MINVSILSLNRANLASIADARQSFIMVNELLRNEGKQPKFNIKLVGLSKDVVLSNGSFSIHTDAIINEEKPNLIIIPSMTGDMMSATHQNREFAIWIAQQYKDGAEVASLCVGAFLLAFSGILKGKQCTTHWLYANEFRHFYPTVKLLDEKVITDQNGIYSSGGNNAYWNLLIYLIEKYTDRKIAIHAAKYFVVDIDKNIQSPFIIFHGLKDHEDESIRKAQDYIEQNYWKKFIVEKISNKFNLTRRTFERRFKKATRHTVIEYIQRVKVEATKKQLEVGRKSVNEIMYSVGYADIQSYREIFKKITGMTPIEYRNKYNREI